MMHTGASQLSVPSHSLLRESPFPSTSGPLSKADLPLPPPADAAGVAKPAAASQQFKLKIVDMASPSLPPAANQLLTLKIVDKDFPLPPLAADQQFKLKIVDKPAHSALLATSPAQEAPTAPQVPSFDHPSLKLRVAGSASAPPPPSSRPLPRRTDAPTLPKPATLEVAAAPQISAITTKITAAVPKITAIPQWSPLRGGDAIQQTSPVAHSGPLVGAAPVPAPRGAGRRDAANSQRYVPDRVKGNREKLALMHLHPRTAASMTRGQDARQVLDPGPRMQRGERGQGLVEDGGRSTQRGAFGGRGETPPPEHTSPMEPITTPRLDFDEREGKAGLTTFLGGVEACLIAPVMGAPGWIFGGGMGGCGDQGGDVGLVVVVEAMGQGKCSLRVCDLEPDAPAEACGAIRLGASLATCCCFLPHSSRRLCEALISSDLKSSPCRLGDFVEAVADVCLTGAHSCEERFRSATRGPVGSSVSVRVRDAITGGVKTVQLERQRVGESRRQKFMARYDRLAKLLQGHAASQETESMMRQWLCAAEVPQQASPSILVVGKAG